MDYNMQKSFCIVVDTSVRKKWKENGEEKPQNAISTVQE